MSRAKQVLHREKEDFLCCLTSGNSFLSTRMKVLMDGVASPEDGGGVQTAYLSKLPASSRTFRGLAPELGVEVGLEAGRKHNFLLVRQIVAVGCSFVFDPGRGLLFLQ